VLIFQKLLMMKAAEDLKQQGMKREQERQSALSSRIPPMPNIDAIEDKGKLVSSYNIIWTPRVYLFRAAREDLSGPVR